MAWFRKNFKSIALAVSLVLNALGGAGIVPPVVAEKGGNIASELAK